MFWEERLATRRFQHPGPNHPNRMVSARREAIDSVELEVEALQTFCQQHHRERKNKSNRQAPQLPWMAEEHRTWLMNPKLHLRSDTLVARAM